jgi:serine/threonine protein phosphatase 1
VHAEVDRLRELHRAIEDRLEPGDRVVYCGNIIGRGPDVAATLDEVLAFRNRFLTQARSFVCDIAYLRGSQEEMWQKLMQIQFATDPRGVLTWMLEQGIGPTLDAYGHTEAGARRAASSGAMQMTRWTTGLRQAMQARPGHYQIFSSLRRAAFTEGHELLFVNAGLDPSRPLDSQKDSFWWSSGAFSRIDAPYGGFQRVVRGYAPAHPGLVETPYTVTLDAGAGFGGGILAACLLPSGEIVEKLEA